MGANNRLADYLIEVSCNAVNGQLEQIWIYIFVRDKQEFPQRHRPACLSFVDSPSLSSQFKMLRLKGCLAREAAYETAKVQLRRKYGGSGRQVQGHHEKLKKIKMVH